MNIAPNVTPRFSERIAAALLAGAGAIALATLAAGLLRMGVDGDAAALFDRTFQAFAPIARGAEELIALACRRA